MVQFANKEFVYIYQGVAVVSNEELSDEALDFYVSRGWRRHGTSLTNVHLTFAGGEVGILYLIEDKSDEVIPRPDGYVAKVV